MSCRHLDMIISSFLCLSLIKTYGIFWVRYIAVPTELADCGLH